MVEKGRFPAVKTIDEGIEILTDTKAGERKSGGTYPEGTINYLVNEKLKELAEGMKKFDEEEEKEEKRNRREQAKKK